MRIGLVLLVALVAWVYWPATGADFIIDDYVFIATSRMVDNPLAAFWQSHFYEPYYFRPVGLITWWLATREFFLDYQAHSVVNLAIHAVSVCSLAGLLRTLGATRTAALTAATLFALMPFSLAATLWPSNRFDLLAVLFLIWLAMAVLSVLRGGALGAPGAWVGAALCALAACWSKELAYPAATLIALSVLGARSVSLPRRIGLFVLLTGVISFAFFWRQSVLDSPYAAAGGDVIASFQRGATAWADGLLLFTRYTLFSSLLMFGLVVAALAAAFLLRAHTERRRFGQNAHVDDAARRRLIGLTLVAAAVLATVCAVQWPLAHVFVGMLDGGALGTVTYGRFFYAPMAAFAVLAGLLLTATRYPRLCASLIIVPTLWIGVESRPLAEAFAQWTRKEIRPFSLAATTVADAQPLDAPCVLVLLGTQMSHPYFRMFSDVTVKARSEKPANAWRCYVMSESTPWLFAFPSAATPAPPNLLSVAGEGAERVAKPDSEWGGMRYRYKSPPKDVSALPDARFYEWRDGAFVEVTAEVKSGARVVKFHGWGF